MSKESIPFTVYNASAGAGKTFSLVLAYLRICLSSEDGQGFRKILAITFTNKAAAEMKARIILALTRLSQEQTTAQEDPMFSRLAEDLALTPEQLSARAETCLRGILHAYSAFSVSTIDKFTNRLIRSFAHELNLSTHYEVELDGQQMLEEAADTLLDSLREGDILSGTMVRFMQTQLADGKSPRIEKNLIEMGGNLFSESAQPYLQALQVLSFDDLITIRKSLKSRNTKIEKHLQSLAAGLLDLINEAGIEHKWFNRGYLPAWLQKFTKDGPLNWIPTATVSKQILGEADFFSKANEKSFGHFLEAIKSDLQEGLTHLYAELLEAFPVYHLSALLLRDFYSLAVLRELDVALQELKEETNRLPIGEFNKLIGERLQEQAAPFLYEKLGDRYRHFFIDEFQDTSNLQWNNLVPLINNALAEGANTSSAMLVGDGKQAIYRWRGGAVDQFIALSDDTHGSNKIAANGQEIELYKRTSIQLENNFRSLQNIVAFNNQLFLGLSDQLQSVQHKTLFKAAKQEPKGAEGGYVEVCLNEYEKSTYVEAELNRIDTTIERAIADGYSYGDIALLVRGAKEGKWISDHLFEKGLPLITAATLSLGQSKEVSFIIDFLQVHNRPDDQQAQMRVLDALWEQHSALQRESKHTFLETVKKGKEVVFYQTIQTLWPDFQSKNFDQASLSEKVYQLTWFQNLNTADDLFISAFIDEVLRFEQNEKGTVADLLDWWISRGYKKQLGFEEASNAIRLMTIHKSKGLEFPVVIIPFADWPFKVGVQKEWMPLNPEAFFGLPTGQISLSQTHLDYTTEAYQELYHSNESAIVLDNLNLLYVAMTRAVERLHVFSSEGKAKGDKHIGTFIKAFIEQYGEGGIYTSGTLEPPKREAAQASSKTPLPIHFEHAIWRDKLSISVNAPRDWVTIENDERQYGRIVHEVLANIDYTDEYAREKMPNEEVAHLVESVLSNPELKPYFSKTATVLNERDLLAPGGKILRPDRVVLEGNIAHILDYKTGVPAESHQKQLITYRQQLEQAGFTLGETKLVYLDDTLTIKNVP
jgi:ATP-dependent exoDNAse (exonuclease V) beta subunit